VLPGRRRDAGVADREKGGGQLHELAIEGTRQFTDEEHVVAGGASCRSGRAHAQHAVSDRNGRPHDR